MSAFSQNVNLRTFSYLVKCYISSLGVFHFSPGSCYSFLIFSSFLVKSNLNCRSNPNYSESENVGFHLKKVNCNHNLPGWERILFLPFFICTISLSWSKIKSPRHSCETDGNSSELHFFKWMYELPKLFLSSTFPLWWASILHPKNVTAKKSQLDPMVI